MEVDLNYGNGAELFVYKTHIWPLKCSFCENKDKTFREICESCSLARLSCCDLLEIFTITLNRIKMSSEAAEFLTASIDPTGKQVFARHKSNMLIYRGTMDNMKDFTFLKDNRSSKGKHNFELTSYRWNNDGTRLALGYGGGKSNNGFEIYNTTISKNWVLLANEKGFENSVKDLCWSPINDGLAVIFSNISTLKIYDTNTWRVSTSISGFVDKEAVKNSMGGKIGLGCLDWNLKYGIIAIGGSKGSISACNLVKKSIVGIIKTGTVTQYTNHVRYLRFDPTGNYLAIIETQASNRIKILDIFQGKWLNEFYAHGNPHEKKIPSTPISVMEWDPTGKVLFTSSNDNTIQITEALSGRVIKMFNIEKAKSFGYDAAEKSMLAVNKFLQVFSMST